MEKRSDILKKQFERSFKLANILLLPSGIKISRKPWNVFLDYFLNNLLFYLTTIILHTVIIGEIYSVIDSINQKKSLVETSFNMPCITISILATTKSSFLYINIDILRDFFHKLKEIHCENDARNEYDKMSENNRKIMQETVKFTEITGYKRKLMQESVKPQDYVKNDGIFEERRKIMQESVQDYVTNEDMIEEKRKIIKESVKFLDVVSILMTSIGIIVQVMFCLVPGFIMAYHYSQTQELIIIYPFLVNYHYFDVYVSAWWPLVYFHQIVATAVVCCHTFGADILLLSLCSYMKMHFNLLGLQFKTTISTSKHVTKKNLVAAVRRHQELIEIVNKMELVYSKSSLFHIITASFMICLSAFILTITDEMNVKIAYFTFLTMSLSQIALICLFADMLMRSSTEISEAVYNSVWYETDRDAKKIILLVMIRSQKACKLTAWRFVDLNLRAFTKILSTSWSYFALLRTLYN